MSVNNQDDDQGQRTVWVILIAVVVLACSLAVGVGLWKSGSRAAEPQPEPTAVDATAPTAEVVAVVNNVAPTDDVAVVVVEDGVVKFYFASGSAELATGAAQALADVVVAVGEGRRAIISGYHDATGSAELNAELAKQRAFAVRDALAALGVAEDAVELRKPEVTQADGNNAQARRVEVTLE